MIFKRYELNIFFKLFLLFLALTVAAFLLVKGYYKYELLIIPVIIFLLINLFRFHQKTQLEIDQFVESIHYRDFSRHFNVKQAPLELQPLRQGFNEINSTFKGISKEKETQYQYLQKILELIDTGILSYESENGEVVWMNESLKQILKTPYLKTIHSLNKRDANLYQQIIDLPFGGNIIATVHQEINSFRILLSATAFQTEGKIYKLIAFQNVDEALEETESKAWQKLLSVMTHEIMNSIAPISSLAETLKFRLKESAGDINNANGVADDLKIGIETIQRRSEGLLKFAETYRNLNKINSLNIQKIFVRDLFENLHLLMQPTLQQKKIELEIVLKNTAVILDADTSLIEQVIINLMLNAIEAVKDKTSPKIILSASQELNKKPLIKVSDNGQGMTQEVLDKIFIPFFSTKKTGSGIGLSLCKQIMMLHKGNVHVQSKEGEGTVFYLQF